MPLIDHLQSLEPAAAFLSKRRFFRLLDRMQERGDRVARNAERPLWINPALLPDLGEDSFRNYSLPRLLLLAPPDDRSFFAVPPEALERFYHRLLFRAAIMDEARKHVPSVLEFWNSLSFGQQREIEFVLIADGQVPESPTAEEVSIAAAEIVLDIITFEPDSLHGIFPLLNAEAERIDALRNALSAKELAAKYRTERPRMEAAAATETRSSTAEALAKAEAAKARGNLVRAASLASGSPLAKDCLNELVDRLTAILELPAEKQQAWRDALAPLVDAAGRAAWPREKRALYELQRLAGDFRTPLDAVAPVEWVASFCRKPLRRSLEPVKPVIVVRRLRAALRHVQHSGLSEHGRHAVEHLLEEVIHEGDHKLRVAIRPVIEKAFDDHHLVATNLPERIARDRIVAELMDRLSERGFLRLSDLRDAIARSDLKLRDLSVNDAIFGDQLLLIDKQLHDDLYGVYRRGEIYLRGVQRFSGLAFGTVLGRWITLFLALPFGGAFLAIEAVKHIWHALSAISVALVSVIMRTHAEEGHKEGGHHGLVFDTEMLLWIGGVGAFFFLLINVPPARRVILHIAGKLLRRLSTAILGLPRTIWMSPPVRWTVDNIFTRFISSYILWPAFFAALTTMTVALLDGSVDSIIVVGAASFILALIVGASPLGHMIREYLLEAFHDFGRRLFSDILPGAFRWVMQFFKNVLSFIERTLYSIDEWFRYREGQSKPSLALKVVLGLLWFPVAYVVRFAFNLLIEPQVNPIKHFPVVTVSHKVLLPLIPMIAEKTGLTIETVGIIVTGIPGIFGFLVWEFKENWRLYASNRPRSLKPVMLGHHGETNRGLLRPGFHSGTIPKLYRRYRRLYRKPTAGAPNTDLLHHEEHHIQEAIEHLVKRNLFAYWKTRPALAALEPRIESIRIGVQRIEIRIAIAGGGEPLKLSFENFAGTIVGTIDREGWTLQVSLSERPFIDQSLRGFFAAAAVATVDVPWNTWVKFWEESKS